MEVDDAVEGRGVEVGDGPLDGFGAGAGGEGKGGAEEGEEKGGEGGEEGGGGVHGWW